MHRRKVQSMEKKKGGLSFDFKSICVFEYLKYEEKEFEAHKKR